MADTRVRVSLSFAQLSDHALSSFAGGVIDGLTAQATVFTALPVTVATLTTLRSTFDQAVATATRGSTTDTALKNNARAALIDALRKDALYVEIVSDNDLAVLLSSGYQSTSTNRAQAPLGQVQVVAVENAQTGELKVRIQPVANARSFLGRIKAAGSEFGPSVSFASSRAILFKGLTAGITYTLQLCAIGGSTGSGDWSDPTSHMAM